jgi:hypothetical protein
LKEQDEKEMKSLGQRRNTQNLKIQESLEEHEQREEIQNGLRGVFSMIKEKLTSIKDDDEVEEDIGHVRVDDHMYEICECG